MNFKGIPNLRKLPKDTREALALIDEYLQRTPQQVATETLTADPSTASKLTNPSKIQVKLSDLVGEVERLDPTAPDTLLAMRFLNTPTLVASDQLRLMGDFTPTDESDVLTMLSDGTRLFEVGRASGPLGQTFVPVRQFGARPDTGNDMTTKIQNAFDNCPAGCTLTFEPGTYICNGAILSRNDISLYLTGGTILLATSATTKAVIDVRGTVDTGAGTNLVRAPATDIVYPRGGDRTIYCAAGAEAAFPVDSWIWIEDDEVAASGVPSDPDLELWKHGELVRVKSTSSGVINLYSPIINQYAPEILANNALTAGTGWAVTNGFTLAANTAVYAHNVSGGTLTQLSTTFATPIVASVTYILMYTITASTVAGGDLTLSGVSSGTVTGLPRTVGTHQVTFTTAASPGNFVLTATSTSGGFTMDDIYLALQPRIRAVTPVQNFRMFGAGMISNPQAGADQAHGVRLFHTVGAILEGIVFERCWDSGLHSTRSTEVRVSKCTFRNAVRFDSRGYGFTCHATSRVTVTASDFKRLRHCIDFSTFSRLCTATGNLCIGSTTGNINTHPSVHGVTITGNVIDGGHGQDATSNSTEYGDSTVQASGINIDQGNKNVTISTNVIMNMRFSGILVDFGNAVPANFTEFVVIHGNVIANCQLYRRVTGAGALSNHAGIALLETSAGGTTRRGIECTSNVLWEPGQFGILVGIDNALVANNVVYKAEDKVQAGTAPVVGIGIWAKNSTSTGAPTGIALINNTSTHCTQDGFRVGVNAALVNTINCIVEGNRAVSNGNRGFFFEETAQTPMVRNNYAQLNGGDGMNIQSAGGWFMDNRLISNGGWGMQIIAGGNNNFLRHNLFNGNTSGTLQDLATGTFHIWLDDVNGREGINTAAPARRLEILDASNPALRLTHTAASRYTDFQHNTVVNFGGLCLLPATNADGFKAVNIFGTTESNALTVFDDGTDLYLRTGLARGFYVNVAAGQVARLQQGFSSYIGIDAGGNASSNVPFASNANVASDTVVQALGCVATRSGALPAAGFGASLVYTLETNDGSDPGTFVDCGAWQVVLTNATTASVDTDQRFIIRDNGALKEVLRIDGALPGVMIGDNAAVAPLERFEVDANIRALSLRLDGDTGSGVASTLTYTNRATAIAGGSGPATLGNFGGTNEPAAGGQSHWLKIWDGTTARYIPVWT